MRKTKNPAAFPTTYPEIGPLAHGLPERTGVIVSNPGGGDVLELVVDSNPTESYGASDTRDRLAKAIEHAAHYLPAQGPISVCIHHNTLHAFEHLGPVQDPETAGNPCSDEKWVRSRLRALSKALDHRACPATIGRLLRDQKYGLRSHRKVLHTGKPNLRGATSWSPVPKGSAR